MAPRPALARSALMAAPAPHRGLFHPPTLEWGLCVPSGSPATGESGTWVCCRVSVSGGRGPDSRTFCLAPQKSLGWVRRLTSRTGRQRALLNSGVQPVTGSMRIVPLLKGGPAGFLPGGALCTGSVSSSIPSLNTSVSVSGSPPVSVHKPRGILTHFPSLTPTIGWPRSRLESSFNAHKYSPEVDGGSSFS